MPNDPSLQGAAQQADPTQPYGAAKWLSGQPLFGPLNTPKAVYQGPGTGQMGVPSVPSMPWLDSLPGFGEGDRGDSLAGGILDGADQPGLPGAGPKSGVNSYGSTLGTIGGVMQRAFNTNPFTGTVAAGFGTLMDQINANQTLGQYGAPNLGFSDYFGSMLGNMMPGALSRALGIRTTNERLLDALEAQGFYAGFNEEDQEMGQRYMDAARMADWDAADAAWGREYSGDDDRGGWRDLDSVRDSEDSRDSGAW